MGGGTPASTSVGLVSSSVAVSSAVEQLAALLPTQFGLLAAQLSPPPYCLGHSLLSLLLVCVTES